MKSPHIILNPLLHIVLDRPKIAGNIAAIIRTAVAAQCAVHVCGPLVFNADDKTKWRSGLDYFFGARVHFHLSLGRCLSLLKVKPWLVEVGGSKTPWEINFAFGDVIVLGPETASIDDDVLFKFSDRILTLPKFGPVRSINLAQCTAIVVYEAVRQYMLKFH